MGHILPLETLLSQGMAAGPSGSSLPRSVAKAGLPGPCWWIPLLSGFLTIEVGRKGKPRVYAPSSVPPNGKLSGFLWSQ